MVAARAEVLFSRLARLGQAHIREHFAKLDAAGRERLLAQLEAIDLKTLQDLAELAQRSIPDHVTHEFAPTTVFPLVRDAAATDIARRAAQRGADLLRSGSVGYILVAGGQASRLGYDGPKGAFPVGPVSGVSLFEWFAKKLLAAQRKFGAATPWYVMTSEANDAATRAFFGERDFFGIEESQVFFFSQAMLPALDANGRILMSAGDQVFFAPNGHGGVLSALVDSGGLEDARARGVQVFSYFQVDNPLAPPADPLFLGLHSLEQAQMSTKVVKKRAASEKVGVLGRVDGKLTCIEYSDLPPVLRDARNAQGELVYGAGNIALHAIELAFIERVTRDGCKLPWHLARKSMNVVDEHGAPARRDGFKFERFVFDALRFAERSVTLEVDRREQFSPVKNADGEDSPATARADLCRLFAGWVERAGLPLPPADEHGVHPVEVDPSFAQDVDEFLAARPRAPHVTPRGHLFR